MSLKAFHIVFIAASIVLALGVGYWSLQQYAQQHEAGWLWMGLGFMAAGLGLVFYGKAMLRKLRRIDSI